jgi:glycosyltransferase involved in cell wall biosynthesis
LKKTLNSLLELKKPEQTDFEYLIIDNNSTDSTAGIIKSFPLFKYIFEGKRNRSSARNRGIRESSGDIICFFDSDVEIESDWIIIMYAKMISSTLYGGGEGQIYSKAIGEINLLEKLRLLIKSNSHSLLSLRGRRFPGINTAACIYRKQALLDAELFDENLNYHEDIDLSQAVFRSGYALFENKDAKIKCYNSSPKLFTFVKRNFYSAQEYLKYERKWHCDSDFNNVVGFLRSILSCLVEMTKDLFSRDIGGRLYIIRFILYLSSFCGGIVGAFQIQDTQKGIDQLGLFLDEQGEWGVVENDKEFVLYQSKSRTFKKLPRLFSIDQLMSKLEDNKLQALKRFFGRYKQEIISLSVVGSFFEKNKGVSRNDIDVLVIVNNSENQKNISEDLQKVLLILSPQFDISIFSKESFCKATPLIKHSIHITDFSIMKSRSLFGKLPFRLPLDPNGCFQYQLWLKKTHYYLIEKGQKTLFDKRGAEFDLINLYKLILIYDLDICDLSGIKDKDILFGIQVEKFPDYIKELLVILKSKNFFFSEDEMNKSLTVLCDLTELLVKEFLSQNKGFILMIEEIAKRNASFSRLDIDYLFIQDSDVNPDSYPKVFVDTVRRKILELEKIYG